MALMDLGLDWIEPIGPSVWANERVDQPLGLVMCMAQLKARSQPRLSPKKLSLTRLSWQLKRACVTTSRN